MGVGFGSKTLAFEARLLMEELDFVQDQVKEVERELARLLERTQGKWLVTIPGIDVALASVIAGEIGDPNAFDDPHRLMGYAGMDPTRSESGETVRSDGHMSKRGPGALRWAFMQAADCARKNDPYFGDYYDRKRGVDGKHHYVALSGVAPQAHGRGAGGDEGRAALRAGPSPQPPPRPPEGGVKAHVDRKNRTSPMPGTLHGAGCWAVRFLISHSLFKVPIKKSRIPP